MSSILKNTTPLPKALKIQIMHFLLEEITNEKQEADSERAKITEVLKKMEFAEMMELLANAKGFEISCNIDQLIKAICDMNEKNEIQEEIVWLLNHGATNAMINHVYPSDADPSKLAILRSQFCDSTQKGREKNINKLKDIDEIQKDWHRVKVTSGKTIDHLKIMQQKWPRYSIAQIWQALVP